MALNGPMESAIGAVLSKSFRTTSAILQSQSPLTQKLKAVENSIVHFENSIRHETRPIQLQYLQEGKLALEKEAEKLAKLESERLARQAESIAKHTQSVIRDENPNTTQNLIEVVRGMSESIDSIARMLGESLQKFKPKLDEIGQLLKGNLRENSTSILQKIDSFAELVRLESKIGLELKAKITKVL